MVDNNIIFNNTLLSVQSRDFEEVSLCEIHFYIARATFRSYGNKFCYECRLSMMNDAHFEMTVID